jgi:putative hemolysin
MKKMKINWWLVSIGILIVVVVIVLVSNIVDNDGTGMANPASVYCIEQGGKNIIVTDSQGGQSGLCVFADNSSCDEWAFYRGECEKGRSEGSCGSDSDCVKDACCHASGCVSKKNAPACKDIMCTQECVPGTLDCGQGSCKCINNKCEAVTE